MDIIPDFTDPSQINVEEYASDARFAKFVLLTKNAETDENYKELFRRLIMECGKEILTGWVFTDGEGGYEVHSVFEEGASGKAKKLVLDAMARNCGFCEIISRDKLQSECNTYIGDFFLQNGHLPGEEPEGDGQSFNFG